MEANDTFGLDAAAGAPLVGAVAVATRGTEDEVGVPAAGILPVECRRAEEAAAGGAAAGVEDEAFTVTAMEELDGPAPPPRCGAADAGAVDEALRDATTTEEEGGGSGGGTSGIICLLGPAEVKLARCEGGYTIVFEGVPCCCCCCPSAVDAADGTDAAAAILLTPDADARRSEPVEVTLNRGRAGALLTPP